MATAGSIVVNLIANTGNFSKGMNTASKKLSEFQKSFLSVKSILTSGAIGYAVKGIADGFTEAHKAIREGESAVKAFASALPVLGGIHDSFLNFYSEISGLTEQMEKLNVATDAQGKLTEIIARNIRGRDMTPLEKELALLDSIKQKMTEAGLALPNFENLKKKSVEYYQNLDAGEKARQAQLEKSKKIQEDMNRQQDFLKELRTQVLDMQVDLETDNKWDAMLKKKGGMLDTEQYAQAAKYVEELKALDQKMQEKKDLSKPPEVEQSKKMEQFKPEAREIDTSLVSIPGLAMSGRNYDLDQLNALERIEKNTRKLAGQEGLN